MKTWTNPSVEELEVKLTAAHLFAVTPEEWGNGEIDWDGGQVVVGGSNTGSNEGGNQGGDEGGDIVIGQGS